MKQAIITAAVLFSIPTLALAGPVAGIGYSDIGLSGHAGRPGVQFNAGDMYPHDVIASGSASFARGYFSMNADIGKLIQANGVAFEPYVSLGFLNLNYTQPQQQSIQDLYGLAGVNLSIPISNKVEVGIGGGLGHTLTTFGGNSGSVYTGDVIFGGKIAPHVTASLDVSYTHTPGASMTSYGAGLAYHF